MANERLTFSLTLARSRHVKCDEAKPSCNRCGKSGRQCEGYAPPTKPRKSPDQLTIINYVAPSRSVSPFPPADPRELRALDYFENVTAPELAGAFSPDLWSRFMLLLAHIQAPVKHALVALGTVHEEFTNVESPCSDFPEYANREYNKAIKAVVQLNVSGSPQAVEIALTACVIFSCLESLRGHFQSSLSHLMSGLSVLEEQNRQGVSALQPCIPRELLLSLFMRMDSQRLDIGGAATQTGTMLSMSVRPSIPQCFTSIEEARFQIDILYNHTLHFFYRVEEAALFQPQPEGFWDGFLAQRQTIECIRQDWERSWNSLLGRGVQGSASRTRTPGAIVLDMNNTAIKLMLCVDILEPESDFDSYTDLFQSMLSDADEYVQRTSEKRSPLDERSPSSAASTYSSPTPGFASAMSRPPSTTPSLPKPLRPKPEPYTIPKFTLSLGCVPIIYLCAARCRDTKIRYRALELLRKCNRREGLWDSNIAARIAEGVIAIEEAKVREAINGIKPSSGKATPPSPRAAEVFIPDRLRVKAVDVKFGPEAHGKTMYTMEYPTRSLSNTEQIPSGRDTSKGNFGELYEW